MPRRRLVLVAALVLLVIGGAVFAGMREGGTSGPGSFCWGLLPARQIEALLPEGDYEELGAREDRIAGGLDYPGTSADECRIGRVGDPRGLSWAEYRLLDAFDRQQVEQWGLIPGTRLLHPLGAALVGFVSDLGGVVEVPSCLGTDGPRYFQLIVRDLGAEAMQAPSSSRVPVRTGNHARISDVLVSTANAIRARAGCTGEALPAAVPPPEAPATQYDPGMLCGRQVAGAGLPAKTGWTQQRTEPGGVAEDCLLWDPADRLDPSQPTFGLTVHRGRLAALTPQDKYGTGIFSMGQNGALYRAECRSGPVFYQLQVRPVSPFADPVALLRTIVQADADRDGCALP